MGDEERPKCSCHRGPPPPPRCVQEPTFFSKLNCVSCNRLFFFLLGASIGLYYEKIKREAKQQAEEAKKKDKKGKKGKKDKDKK